ncbi:MAG: hypothetical protein RLZZ520_608, partial [Bacteroidota bacterium]
NERTDEYTRTYNTYQGSGQIIPEQSIDKETNEREQWNEKNIFIHTTL